MNDELARDGRPPERLLPDTWRRPVLGVLGGMGPAATVAFLDALVRATPARSDQEHIDTVVLNHATVPDRTLWLRDPNQANPAPYLMADLELLARLGADCAVIACNTAHAFLDEHLPLPLLSLIEVGAQEAVNAALATAPDHPVVTVLATEGTLLSGVYQDAVTRRGAQVRLPDEPGQQRLMSMIYDGVKAGVDVPTDDFVATVRELREGDDAVLLGCTELSVLAEQTLAERRPLPEHVIDAQAALVARVVQHLTGDGHDA